jgi:hypothetical protein
MVNAWVDVFERENISQAQVEAAFRKAEKLESAQSSYRRVTAEEIDSQTDPAQNETIQ